MQEKIDRMYRGDCALIITFLVFLWLVLIGVISVVAGIAETPVLKTVAMGSGLVAGIAATTGMLAVISHLRKNKDALYTEDITCTRLMQEAE